MKKSSSLRVQISYRIFLYSVFILMLGGAVAIWQARNAVQDEVESSINLALQLVKLGFSTAPNINMNETGWLYRLSGLNQTRHLNIQIKDSSGRMTDITEKTPEGALVDMPPQWFIDLVSGIYPKAEYPIQTADKKPLTLIIQANPLDEIIEIWQETVNFFVTICALLVLTFLAVHLVFNKTLNTIGIIIENLKIIETGEYRQKLPEFDTQEYDHIARAINHMTEVLELTRRQNQALTQHSLQIQEEERQRLSQELHDELGQSLTAVKVMAATARHQQADIPPIMASITEICDHLMAVVRSMMQQLHPLILTELGLKATIAELTRHWRERNPALTINLQCDDQVDHLDQHITIQLFRVIQECLTNINRHADATEVNIEVVIAGDRLQMHIQDNGQGCELDECSTGFGLLGMRERIKSLDGRFKVVSKPGEGMSIQANMPVDSV